ncbi:hypothetical protein [Celeribacter sp. PS-C1]|uniref:hypothetical protein n=1 Tax=Celeribacter sp. PS-C1 TaxID=2820813 RepID=UPI001CA5F2AE|nr:hypothetical protein [Celeribacter sp. PS-C1]MBW6416438.1 hypothetical protein [Celeribacter sp. PS-C1]
MTDNSASSKRGFLVGAIYVSLGIHVLWLILFSFVILVGPFQKNRDDCSQFAQSIEVFQICELGELAGNALATAGQMGRLDIVSLSLTVLGVVLASAALGSFFLIRGAAKDAAADEAVEWLDKKKSQLITTELVEKSILNDRIVLTLANEVEKRISHNKDGIDGKTADSIAESMKNDEL